MKKTIKLTESQLHKIIKESVSTIINESIPKHLRQAIDRRNNELETSKLTECLQNEVNDIINNTHLKRCGFNCTSVYSEDREFLIQIEDNMGGAECDATKTDIRVLMNIVCENLKGKGYRTITRWVERESLYGGIVIMIKIEKNPTTD